MHVALVWRYRDWSRIRDQWISACPSSQYVTFIAKRKDGKPSSPSSVAKYLGKYLSKGADLGGFNATMRADVSAAFYNQRSVLASLGFWLRIEKCCRTCRERFRLVELEAVSVFDRIASGPLSLYFHGLEPPRLP